MQACILKYHITMLQSSISPWPLDAAHLDHVGQASEAQNTAAPRRRSGLGRTVFFVANESALALIDMVNLHKSLAACSLPVSWQRSTTIMGCSLDTLRQACSHHLPQEYHPPKTFQKVAQVPLILPCPWHGHVSEQQCYTSMTRLPPAWPCAESIIYTDVKCGQGRFNRRRRRPKTQTHRIWCILQSLRTESACGPMRPGSYQYHH